MSIPTTESIIAETTSWLEKAVIGLNLCPFAKAVHLQKKIRYVVTPVTRAEDLLAVLQAEYKHLDATNPSILDTTLLIHPFVLTDFLDYNAFLEVADIALVELGLEGKIQVASFHPQYQFANTQPDDIENYTNRAPYPTLHLLRESSVEEAIAVYPDTDKIFEKNIETLRALGHEGWKKLID